MSDRHWYEPSQGHGLPHDPIGSIIGPRPIGWISTDSGEGRRNLAPYSFFNLFNYRPGIIGFASCGYKDTLRNAERTGEFVWNLVTRALAERMNATSATVASDIDEFDFCGLTSLPSVRVAAPRVAESPVNLECKVTQIIQLHDRSGDALSTWLVMGEIVGVHIAHHLLRDGLYVIADAAPVLRGGGRTDYFEIQPGALFRMNQPA
ncbi:MAG: flavin reductase family protein [Acidiferrobacteraceae bacterium]